MRRRSSERVVGHLPRRKKISHTDFNPILIMRLFSIFLSYSLSQVIELEEFIRQTEGEKFDEIIFEMGRKDSLFQLGDTRDLVFAMLHYK